MFKCYKEVLVPSPQEINTSNKDKKKVKAFVSFDKNSHVKKTYFFSNSDIGCSIEEYLWEDLLILLESGRSTFSLTILSYVLWEI